MVERGDHGMLYDKNTNREKCDSKRVIMASCEKLEYQIDRKALGFRVYMARVDAHMNVKMLAGQIGVSEIFIRQVEMGRKLPSLTNLKNICKALHISPTYLLCGDLTFATADPVKKAIEVVSNCSPREADMVIDMLKTASMYLQKKTVVRL